MENANYNKDQVFVNFRGKDQRYSFLTHLKAKLLDVNVNVFTDEEDAGQPLAHLYEQIRKSRMAIVLFTENYAESEWCLDELVEIKKCVETKQLKAVIPIFYKVRATNVQELSGEFGEKFMALQNSLLAEAGDEEEKKTNVNARIQGWSQALKVVSEMIGLRYVEQSSEADFVKKIVDNVTVRLAKIAAEEGRNIAPEPDKISQAKAANIIMFNVNVSQLNITNHYEFSETLKALFLVGRNLEGNNGTPYAEEPSEYKVPEPRVPQEGPHPAYGRTVSFNDIKDLIYPLNVEPVYPKHGRGQRSVDNTDLRKDKNVNTSCVSSLSYYLKLCFCLASGAKNDLEDLRNEPSLTSNNQTSFVYIVS